MKGLLPAKVRTEPVLMRPALSLVAPVSSKSSALMVRFAPNEKLGVLVVVPVQSFDNEAISADVSGILEPVQLVVVPQAPLVRLLTPPFHVIICASAFGAKNAIRKAAETIAGKKKRREARTRTSVYLVFMGFLCYRVGVVTSNLSHTFVLSIKKKL